MKALELIVRTREYLNYLEEHIGNVSRAWKELQEKCKDMRFISDDFVFFGIDAHIKSHDLSKLGEYELAQYRRKFFPVDKEIQEPEEIAGAFQHHYDNNSHHWQNWTKSIEKTPYDHECHCVCMVVDWMAMGYKFSDTAQAYYEKNKDNIELPEWAVNFIYEIFTRLTK
jgi:hypothetical protein